MIDSPPAPNPRGFTLHLTPVDVWLTQHLLAEYRPEAFAEEGFVHCTDGEAAVIEVGNRYYRDDPRPYVVLDVDLSRVSAPAIFEDDARRFPHIYGPIEREAVTGVRLAVRGADGTFLAIGVPFHAGSA